MYDKNEEDNQNNLKKIDINQIDVMQKLDEIIFKVDKKRINKKLNKNI